MRSAANAKSGGCLPIKTLQSANKAQEDRTVNQEIVPIGKSVDSRQRLVARSINC
jgi:hypothetical protein